MAMNKEAVRVRILELIDEDIKDNKELRTTEKILMLEQRNRIAKLFGLKEIGISILRTF